MPFNPPTSFLTLASSSSLSERNLVANRSSDPSSETSTVLLDFAASLSKFHFTCCAAAAPASSNAAVSSPAAAFMSYSDVSASVLSYVPYSACRRQCARPAILAPWRAHLDTRDIPSRPPPASTRRPYPLPSESTAGARDAPASRQPVPAPAP